MSEDDLMDEIDLFVEIDGLRAELAAARAEVGRLTEKVNRARDAADHWYHVSADLQTELEEARKSRDHWMEVAGSQLAACQKLQAERGPAEAAPPRPRPIRESLAEIAYQAEREAWYELTGNRSSPWHQVGDEVREVMRRVVDAVAAALDGTPAASLPAGTGRPAVAGWYWGRWHKDEKADIVHIGEGGPTGPGFWEPFEWAGPLPAAPWEGRDE